MNKIQEATVKAVLKKMSPHRKADFMAVAGQIAGILHDYARDGGGYLTDEEESAIISLFQEIPVEVLNGNIKRVFELLND